MSTTASSDTFRQGDLSIAIQDQWRRLRSLLLLLYAPVVVVLGIIVVARARTGIPIANFTVDPLIVVGGAPVYTGFFSTIGGLIWCSTAAICLFTALTRRTHDGDGSGARFLMAAGFVTTVLMIDDIFLFHEIIFPRYVGVPQPVVHVTYMSMVAAFLLVFRADIFRTDFLLLGLALGAFALSVGLDLTATINPLPLQFLFEDGAKMFGIVSWAAYFVRECGHASRPAAPPVSAATGALGVRR